MQQLQAIILRAEQVVGGTHLCFLSISATIVLSTLLEPRNVWKV